MNGQGSVITGINSRTGSRVTSVREGEEVQLGWNHQLSMMNKMEEGFQLWERYSGYTDWKACPSVGIAVGNTSGALMVPLRLVFEVLGS